MRRESAWVASRPHDQTRPPKRQRCELSGASMPCRHRRDPQTSGVPPSIIRADPVNARPATCPASASRTAPASWARKSDVRTAVRPMASSIAPCEPRTMRIASSQVHGAIAMIPTATTVAAAAVRAGPLRTGLRFRYNGQLIPRSRNQILQGSGVSSLAGWKWNHFRNQAGCNSAPMSSVKSAALTFSYVRPARVKLTKSSGFCFRRTRRS